MSQPGRVQQSLDEITGILHAIETGDADRAERCCIDHVHQAAASAFKILERPEATNSEGESV
jgi:DNA-binding GntR family transcriptional regulator